MFQPILISAVLLFFAFALAYLFIAKDYLQAVERRKIYALTAAAVLLGLITFGHPLATIVVIYGGYFIIWLPLCFIFSLAIIHLCKKI